LAYNSFSDKAGEKDRIFVRISVKLPAEVFIGSGSCKHAIISDLSTTGLSFSIDKTDSFPKVFVLHFRLPNSSRSIKVKVERKNSSDVSGVLRIGCLFLEISEEDKKLIDRHVSRSLDCSMSWKAVNIAAFFLFVDALWRIDAYLMSISYKGTVFGKIFPEASFPHSYGIVLLAYAVACFTAFITADNLRAKVFRLRLTCIAVAFIFVVMKNVVYWRLCLWQSQSLFGVIFFGAQSLLIAWSGFAIGISAASLKKMSLVSNCLGVHRDGLRRRKQVEQDRGGGRAAF